MDVIDHTELRIDELYDVMYDVDRAYSDLYEGGSGVGYLGVLIPFDDGVVFADLVIGRNAYYAFRDCLERTSGVKYRDLFDMRRKTVEDLQASLPASAVEEIFRHAREAMAGLRATTQAYAAGIKERTLKIKFPDGSGLTPGNLVDCWHALCDGYSSIRHLRSDLHLGAWLSDEQEFRWRQDVEKAAVEAILAMRECFSWDQMASDRSEGRPLISWSLGESHENLLEELKALLSQVGSKWDLLRAELFREVDEHFEFFLTGGGGPDDGNDEPDTEPEPEPGSSFPRLSTYSV